MSRHYMPVLLLFAVLNLTACNVWYKKGADEEDLRVDQQKCEDETQTLNRKVFIECMERLGWLYKDISAPTGHAETVSSVVTGVETVPATLPQHQTTPVTATEIGTSRPGSRRATESLEVSRKPYQPQNVGGWYQLGGDTDTETGQLQDAKSECGNTGADEEEYVNCMESKGWRPLGFRFSVEEPDDLD